MSSKIADTKTLTKPGIYSYVVPPGITELEIYLWGAGGGSGATTSVTNTYVVNPGTPDVVIQGGTITVTSTGTVTIPTGVTTVTVTATGGEGGDSIPPVPTTTSTGKADRQQTIFSDRRLKTNIKLIGKYANGLNKYSWTYIWGEDSIGAMADEVEQLVPDAIGNLYGFKTVNYAMLGE